ncbi:FG-GAP-like repeat-containing protein, partial [Flavobacteriaceae bacterium]|nr:FG-GAP-like repeat-containing protein [Flavobacteriaceae bacterium]
MRLLKVFPFFLFLFFFQLVLGQATPPTVTLTDTDPDNLLFPTDTVTITATFSQVMTPTPTISISNVVTNVAMLGGTTSFFASDIATNADTVISVYAADIDGDGDMDIVSASPGNNKITWYENNGADDPSWTATDIPTNADYPHCVHVADMDGDGDMDIISASTDDDRIAWYENNNGDGSSWTAVDIATSADGARSVFAADMDGDGDMDIVSASQYDDTIAWYENDGNLNPSWTAANIATSADGARSVFAADMDGDGDMDIVSASIFDNTIAWYENNVGDGSSWTAADIATSADYAMSVYVADMDGDGDMDIVSASRDDKTIAWYENDGNVNPSWTAADIATNSLNARSVYVADIDGNGNMDILSASVADNTIAWYKNDGNADPVWTKKNISTSADMAGSVFAADMDGDGDMDVLSASSGDDTVAWYENGVSYNYFWDVDSGGNPSDGDYFVTVAGTASLTSIAYSGSNSITFTLDSQAPTLSSFTHDHDDLVVNGNETVIITATFSENMISSPTISIGGDDNDIYRVSMTATSSSVWTFTWNVPDLKNGVYFATVSGTDLSGNYYAGTDSITFIVDNTDPTLALVENDADDVLIDGETVLLTASANETISGTPTITITNSGGSNDYAMTSSGVSWTYSYSPPSSYSGVVTFTVEMIDVAGNAASTTISLSADTIIPTILDIRSPMANGTYTDYDGNNSLSDTVSITVNFSESVTVDTTNGNPRLLLNTTPATYVDYIDGSGTSSLTFVSLVSEEVEADPLNVSALELNGGTILDASSNTASLTLPIGTNLADSKSIELDAKNPTISNHSLSDNNNLAPIPTTSVNDGDIATFGFQSDKELLMSSLTVTFTGFTTTVTKTVSGSGPYNYELSFTVSSTFPEGDVEIDISATDQVTTTVVPIGNPTGIFTEEAFPDRIRIDRTAPIITSNANLNSDENTSTGPTITASEGVIFSIDGGADQALISINQQTGVLTFSSAPDYEAPIDTGADNTYEIIVKAIDAVGLTVTQTVNIQINDLNDTFGVEVTQTDIQTTESGETASIGFVLITQPSANVIIGLSLSDTTEGSLGAAQLTFTPDNWNTVQTITINGVDDGLTDGDVTYQLITANTTSNDTSYNGLVVDDVTLTNVDDEIDNDGDGFFDYQDAFPNDPTEWIDTDNDSIGNNTDLDDDGDGISDVYEIQLGTDPLDPNDTPSDFNANGIPDALEDSDGDGYNDDIDLYPLDPTRAIDNDGDGIADTDDDDDDNDGIPDDQDDFPLNSRYSKDTDNDGIPNLIDPDDDGDGYDDGEDVFPLDETEHEDTDLDGIGNNADTDDDGDGILDVAEDEFITIKQVYTIEVQGSNKSIFVPIPKTPIERKNVGKWKVRKKITGGADRAKFTITGGEPASPNGTAQQKSEETEGYLVFINLPDINNPSDQNRDNIYEVEVSYINTIGGDERVPDPENKGEIKVNGFELNVFELKSNPIPLEEAEGFEITSDLDGDSIINSLDPDDDGDGILSLYEKGDVLLSEEDVLLDTDEDSYVDFQDPDDDNDGIF